MPISSQRASILGSFCGRFAFMGKSVLGRFSVALSSCGNESLSNFRVSLHYSDSRRSGRFAIPDVILASSFGHRARSETSPSLGCSLLCATFVWGIKAQNHKRLTFGPLAVGI